MNERIFRGAVLNQVYNGALKHPAGVVLELNIPVENVLRTMWCHYDNYDIANAPKAGDEANIQFFLSGELVAEFPAVLRLTSTTRLGVANYREQGLSGYSLGAATQNTLFFDNEDSTGVQYCVQAFTFKCRADTARLTSNREGNTQSILAILSLPA